MDLPAASSNRSINPGAGGRQRRGRGALSHHERSLIFPIIFAILSLMKLGPLVREYSVQQDSKKADLPNNDEDDGAAKLLRNSNISHKNYGYNTSMTADAVYRPIIGQRDDVNLVTMSCAANGKYPFLMHEGGITNWVCNNRGEQAVTAVMVKIFEEECVNVNNTPPSSPNSNNLMLDVGSNHGYYGLLALKMECEALLFDLQPECQQMINNAIVRNNFTMHGRLIPRGVSDDEGLLMVPSKGCEGRYPAKAHEQHNFNQGDTPVHLNPLADFIRSDQPILMMKVDTEGNEKRVIDGSMQFFERRLIKNAIVELTPEPGFWKNVGVTATEVAVTFAHLSELGYTLVSLFDYSVLSTPEDVSNYIMKSRKQFDMWITNNTVDVHDIEAIKV